MWKIDSVNCTVQYVNQGLGPVEMEFKKHWINIIYIYAYTDEPECHQKFCHSRNLEYLIILNANILKNRIAVETIKAL